MTAHVGPEGGAGAGAVAPVSAVVAGADVPDPERQSAAPAPVGPRTLLPVGPRTLLIVNRNSRSGADQADFAHDRLRDAGMDVREVATASLAETIDAIRDHRSHVDRIVVGGGDGTLHNLVPEVLKTGLPLGILPLGTANDLARSLAVPPTLEEACDVIARGHRRSIDLGFVNDRPFLNAANVGAGVALTRQLSGEGKRRWGVFGYCLAAVQTAGAFRPFEAEIVCGGVNRYIRAIQITIGNGPHHGGLLTVSDRATLDDGKLHGYGLRPPRAWEVPGVLWALRTGRQREADSADTFRGEDIEIRTDRPMRVIADGEPVGRTPARFRIVHDALSVFAAPPAAIAPGAPENSAMPDATEPVRLSGVIDAAAQ